MPKFIDTDSVPLKNVFRTPEGYLKADAFAVRTGVQRYLGSEVGRPELPVVDIYRPPEEVFQHDSVATFAHAPITVDHPAGGVTAATWREKAVGEVSTEAMRDGERLKLQLIVKDARAISEVDSGKRRQLSAGYTCDIDWSAPGVTADGVAYLGIQRNIQVNHLALVERGRAGNCQIGDSAWGTVPLTADGAAPHHEEVQMDIKTLVFGDAAVKVVAEDESKIAAYVAKLIADAETARGENAALQQKLTDAEMTPEKLQKMVADRARVAAGYKALTGKDAPADMTDSAMRKDAVVAKLGDSAKEMSDESIAGAFAAFTAQPAGPDPLRTSNIRHQDGLIDDADMSSIFKAAGVTMKKEA